MDAGGLPLAPATPAVPQWTTACPDWEERIVAGRSLLPLDPLFPDEAEAALKIYRDLVLVDVAGRPTMAQACLPWAFDLPRALFGSYDPVSGRRLIRYYFEFVAKKNAKSTRAAGIMITALIRNWRESGEFYILAPTKEIADNSFIPARDMVNADPGLKAILKPSAGRVIEHRNTGAFLKVVAADNETVTGKKTIGLLIDELWLFGYRAGAETMLNEIEGGLASRPEGFVINLSTQSNRKPAGVFEQRLQRFRDIRDGKLHDPSSLPLLHEFPKYLLESKAYREPANWHIPNPNLTKSVDVEFIRHKLAEAERAGKASVIDIEAKHLNVQIGNGIRADGWAGALIWDRGLDQGLDKSAAPIAWMRNRLTLDALLDRCDVVTIGVDGGGLDDMLGVGVIGREKGTQRWLGWACGMISTIGVVRRKANAIDYIAFKRAGDLTVFRFSDLDEASDDPDLAELMDGALPPLDDPNALPPDIRFIVDLVARIRDRGLLAQVGVDAAGIGAIVDALAGIGITQEGETLDAVRQGIALMGAVKTVERKLADHSFRHGGQPLLGWCVSNLKVVQTPTAMRIARDEAGFGKVDPAMALFNAAHLMSLNPEPTVKVSAYESRSLLMV
ncbi:MULTISPECIES: terminase large subunit [unclassified Bradyrhizobium]|uniref:terminase large subunit n=1 Tax=unclassified Bradyrhizobium TaxID=2631580 RepID=UPI0029164B8D|nr:MULTISPECIES: terminase large subunit [unclassified Bradyrhizobium]